MNHSNEFHARHQQAWALLPWYVNGTASPDECRIVEGHLAQCEDCREEHGFQRRLAEGMASTGTVAADPAAGLERLWKRIDRPVLEEAGKPDRRAYSAMRGRRGLLVYGLAAIVILQTGALSILGAHFIAPHANDASSAAYRTLSSPDAGTQPGTSRATIRFVPGPNMRMEEIGVILNALQLQIVAGPTEAGVYSLASTAAGQDVMSQVARLRAIPGVQFAEPVGTPGGAH